MDPIEPIVPPERALPDPLKEPELAAGVPGAKPYIAPAPPKPAPAPTPAAPASPIPPVEPPVPQAPAPDEPPHHHGSSWGVIIAILIMLGLMVVGAFYAWGKRISEQNGGTASTLLVSPAKRV